METIIQQFVQKLTKKLLEEVAANGGLAEVDVLCSHLNEICQMQLCNLITQLISFVNHDFREEKTFRRELGYVMKERDRPRSILTEIGNITYARDCYTEKASGHCCFPLDAYLGVAKRERVSDQLSARLVEEATKMSYQRSADVVAGGHVSRQTVCNKIQELGHEEIPIPAVKKQVRELHIFADEDHVHLQDRKHEISGSKSRSVPMICLTEGIKDSGNGRRSTIGRVAFVDRDFDTHALWDRVAGYLAAGYDPRRVCIHGDGGNWIKRGLDVIPDSVPVLDGFHIERALKSVASHFPNMNYRHRILEAIRKNDIRKVNSLMSEMVQSTEDEKLQDKIRKTYQYIFNNWEGAVNRYAEGMPGSCTEGMVSHILSERLSRNPMGWSEEGVGAVSDLRTYVINGGKIEGKDFRRNENEKYRSALREYADNMFDMAIEGFHDWSIFEKASLIIDQNSGTQQLLRHLGERHNPLC